MRQFVVACLTVILVSFCSAGTYPESEFQAAFHQFREHPKCIVYMTAKHAHHFCGEYDFYELSDCKGRYRCYGRENEPCEVGSRDERSNSLYKICSERRNLVCSRPIGETNGRCESTLSIYSNTINKKSTLYGNRRFPMEFFLMRNQMNNIDADSSDSSDNSEDLRK